MEAEVPFKIMKIVVFLAAMYWVGSAGRTKMHHQSLHWTDSSSVEKLHLVCASVLLAFVSQQALSWCRSIWRSISRFLGFGWDRPHPSRHLPQRVLVTKSPEAEVQHAIRRWREPLQAEDREAHSCSSSAKVIPISSWQSPDLNLAVGLAELSVSGNGRPTSIGTGRSSSSGSPPPPFAVQPRRPPFQRPLPQPPVARLSPAPPLTPSFPRHPQAGPLAEFPPPAPATSSSSFGGLGENQGPSSGDRVPKGSVTRRFAGLTLGT